MYFSMEVLDFLVNVLILVKRSEIFEQNVDFVMEVTLTSLNCDMVVTDFRTVEDLSARTFTCLRCLHHSTRNKSL